MAQVVPALLSLVPVAGAVALTVQGLGRMRRSRSASPQAAPPQPIVPVSAAPLHRAPPQDGLCAHCGTTVPARQTRCAACARAAAGQEFSGMTLLAHWLVFLAVMTAIIGTGWLLAP